MIVTIWAGRGPIYSWDHQNQESGAQDGDGKGPYPRTDSLGIWDVLAGLSLKGTTHTGGTGNEGVMGPTHSWP